MHQEQKIRVAVLFGGKSAEHEVSLLSAANVIQHLDANRFTVVPIGIAKDGSWYLEENRFPLEVKPNAENLLFSPDSIRLHQPPMNLTQHRAPLFDVVFPVIHGTFCEDGIVQGLLEMMNIPYVGCGVLSSAIGMDKDIAKRLIQHAGLNTSRYLKITLGEWQLHREKFCQQVHTQLTFPLFVKPVNAGSSIGIQKVHSLDKLSSAINHALLFDTKVLVEEAIDAIEVEVSVLESLQYGEEPIVSVCGEIRSRHEFYSYEAKYIDEFGAELIIPAPLSNELLEQIRMTAKTIFTTLGCEGMARVDLFVERNTHKIYFNEINSIPGFTQISMYPKLMAASGISYTNLLSHLIDVSIKSHQRKSALQHDYTSHPELEAEDSR